MNEQPAEDDDKPPLLQRYTGNCGPCLLFGGGCGGAFLAPSLAVSLAEGFGQVGIVGGALCLLLGTSWILWDVSQGKKRAGVSLSVILLGLPFMALFIAVQTQQTLEDLRWKRSNTGPSSALACLRGLHEAQEKFRKEDMDGDGKQDFGSLAELLEAGLIDASLGSGTRVHYVFECEPSTTDGEQRWFATARPTGSYPGDPFFCTNQDGKIFYRVARSEKPFRLNTTDCVIPADAKERR